MNKMENEEFYLPTLHSFAMNNIYTGSVGLFRFRIAPNVIMATKKEVDMEASSMKVECWHGMLCYEKSQMEAEETFPMSEEGRENMKSWLISKI